MALHFVADLHFNSDDIALVRKHGFADRAEMTRRICDTWCKRVGAADTVYIIGYLGNSVHLGGLPGNKHLIRSSADPLAMACLCTGRLASVADRVTLPTRDGPLTLVHDPRLISQVNGKVLHGTVQGGWAVPDHHCVAASECGWGPITLQALLAGDSAVQLTRAA